MFGRPSVGGRAAASAMPGSSMRGKRDSHTAHTHMMHAHAAAGQFSFPILSVEEIMVCLAELNIHVEEEDLTKARPEAIRNVYEQLIYECVGMSKEELYMPKYDCMDPIKYEELHEESIPVLQFIRAMNKLLMASGASDGFSLRELVKPDPARVRRNLSAIINFQKYKEERIAVYSMHTAKTEELMRVKAELQARNDELQRQLKDERALRAAEMPAIEALRSELETLSGKRDELDAAISRTRAVTAEQKETILALKDAIASADSKIESVRSEIDTKRGHIIASPARLKAEVEHAARQLEEARGALSAAEADNRTVKRRLEIVLKADKDVRKALTLLADLESNLGKLKQAARDVKGKQADVDAVRKEVASLEAQADHLVKGIRRAEDRLSQFRDQSSAKEHAMGRACETARHELQAIHEDIARAKEARRLAEQRKAEIEAEKERTLARHNAEMADMMAGIKHLQKLVTDYHARLFKGVSEAAERAVVPPVPSTPAVGM